uniref:cytochrome P450 n=1 Tax=Phaeobacter italicus TaxID=481446 RepID=UPI00248E29B8
MTRAIAYPSSSRSEGRLLTLVLGLAILVTLAPVARLFHEGLTAGGGLNPGFLAEVLAKPATRSALWHSLVTAGLGTLISVLIGGVFAFLVALTDLRRKAALVFCLMIPMMIPPQITALSWTQVMGPSSVFLKTLGLAPPLGAPQPLYSPGGIILLLGIQHTSIIFLTLRAGLRAIPQDAVEAARISGARGLRIWWQVVLPLTLPSLLGGIAITFVTALGNFGIPAMLGIPAGYATLPTLIYQRLAGLGTAVLAEVAVLAMLIGAVAIAGILLQRFFQRRQRLHLTGPGGRALMIPLGRARLPVEIALWLVIAAILVLPMAGLLATSLVPAYGVPLRLDTLSLDGWHEALFRQPATRRAFVNSFLLSAGAAALLGNRAAARLAMKQFEGALADAEAAVKLDAGWAKGHFRRGQALAGLERWADARAAFEEVLRIVSPVHAFFRTADCDTEVAGYPIPDGAKIHCCLGAANLDPEKWPETRIIFTDTETSNWTWDPVARQFFWHRFFSHQPDLNFENPAVREAIHQLEDVIAAEDTRRAAKLCANYGITTRRISLHEHNEASRTPSILARLSRGETVAGVSDAGPPLISDSGSGVTQAVLD